MQFQVPQFIDVEEKIVGPLTLRQFLYLAGGFLISIIFYFTVNFGVWIFITLIVGAIAVTLAFVKVNGQPILHIGMAFLSFYLKPHIYVWQPEKPEIPKSEENIKKNISVDLVNLVEKIISGLSLKKVSERVMVGSLSSTPKSKRLFENTKERYELFKKISGEKTAARRIDYR